MFTVTNVNYPPYKTNSLTDALAMTLDGGVIAVNGVPALQAFTTPYGLAFHKV